MDVQQQLDIIRSALQSDARDPPAAFPVSSHVPTESSLELVKAPAEDDSLAQQVTQLAAQLTAAERSEVASELKCKALVKANESLQNELQLLKKQLEVTETESKEARMNYHRVQHMMEERERRVVAVERDFRLLQNDVKLVCESQWPHVAQSVEELRSSTSSLVQENVILKNQVAAIHTLQHQLEELTLERDNWKGEAAIRTTENDRWREELLSLHHHCNEVKTLMCSLQALWVASEEENKVLVDTIRENNIQLTQWEAMFAATQALPSIALPGVPEGTVAVGEDSHALSTPPPQESSAGLLPLLEAKTVDLALALHSCTTEYQQKARQCDALTQLQLEAAERMVVADVSKAIEPLSDAMLVRNQQLEAQLVTSNHITEALLEVYHLLLEEYVEEVSHSFQLEAALAERILPTTIPSPPSSSSLMAISHGAPTAKKRNRFTFSYDSLHNIH